MDEREDEFLEKCMTLVEMIVSINANNSREDCLEIAKKMRAKAETCGKPDVFEAYKNVVTIFEFISEQEFETLRKTVFPQ